MLLGSMAVKSSTPASLGIAVAVDVPLGGLDRPGGGGKDEEASCPLIGEYFCLFSRHLIAAQCLKRSLLYR
jgi:hypothetical protein